LLKETTGAFDGAPRPPHYESDVQPTAVVSLYSQTNTI